MYDGVCTRLPARRCSRDCVVVGAVGWFELMRRFAVSEHLSGPPLYYYYSFSFRFLLLLVLFSPPPGAPSLPVPSSSVRANGARADILTPRQPPSPRRRSAHPRRGRHTYPIGPKTHFASLSGKHRASSREPFPPPTATTAGHPPPSHGDCITPRAALCANIVDDHRIPLERRRRRQKGIYRAPPILRLHGD